ncbi:MAG: hypothetical protein IJ762_04635 [Bacteroidaceae bacterium]|nr:hypothetical protein [Bacteroidaceae bacterium]
MKQDWTEKMRRKLEGHEQTPPAGLWEGISEQMGLPQESLRRRSAILGRWWWGVAASVVAIAVGFLVLHESGTEGPTNSTMRERPVAALRHDEGESEIAITKEDRPKVAENSRPKISGHSRPRHVIVEMLQAEPETADSVSEAEPPMAEVENESEKEVSVGSDFALTESDTVGTHFGKKAELLAWEHQREVASTSSAKGEKRSRLSISLDASGGLADAHDKFQESLSYLFNDDSDCLGAADGDETQGGVFSDGNLRDYEAKHYMPVRFGIGLQYRLTERVALLTGVRYTLLRSRFSMFHGELTADQHLHYLGLPLGVRYQFWGNRHFQFYISANATLDKCLNERPWQWSLFEAVGVEYLPTRRMSIYAEPSVGYYFKDRTSLRHYYKQHPFTPSLEFGLRLHLER